MREIAALKRRVPGAAAKGFADGFWEGVKGDEAAFEASKGFAVANALDGEDDSAGGKNKKKRRKSTSKAGLLEGLGKVDRLEEVEGAHVGVVETLGRLTREMPATVARMERARVAGEYVVTER